MHGRHEATSPGSACGTLSTSPGASILAASVASCHPGGVSSEALVDAVIHVLADAIRVGAQFAVKSLMEGFDGLNEGSAKVHEALRELRQRDFVEILVCAVWHDGVLTEPERARFLDELRQIEADALAELLESPRLVDGGDDEVLEAHVRRLAEGFTDAQCAYAVEAVERVLSKAARSEPEAAGAYRTAAHPADDRGVARSIALFRRALLGR